MSQLNYYHNIFASQNVDFISKFIKNNKNILNTNIKGLYPIHIVAWYNSLDVLKCLIKMGADIDSKCYKNNTPLILSVFNDDVSVFEYLLNNTNIYHKNDDGMSVIHCIFGRKNTFEMLKLFTNSKFDFGRINIDLGDGLEEKDNLGFTPIFYAVNSADIKSIKYLINLVDVEAKNNFGETPLHYACRYRDPKIISLLIENCKLNWNAKNTKGRDMTHIVSKYRHEPEILSLLIENGASLESEDYCGNTAIHFAIKNKNINMISYLIENGNDLDFKNEEGNTALHLACQYDKFEFCKLLLENGADPNVVNLKGESAVHTACKFSSRAIIDILYNFKGNFESYNYKLQKPIHITIKKRAFAIAKNVIRKTKVSNINSPIFTAYQEGKIQILKLLIRKGYSLSAKNQNEKTILNLACRTNDLNMIKILDFNNVDFEEANCLGETCAHIASKFSNKEVIQFLVEKKIDFMKPDIMGITPIYILCNNRSFDFLDLSRFE